MSLKIILIGLCFLGSFFAQAFPTEELSLSYGFSEMDLYKFSYKTQNLTPVDMNGDGLLDLVLVDNQKAKIEFLLQTKTPPPAKDVSALPLNEKDLEDNNFLRQGFYTEKWVHRLCVGDFNGDQKQDLVISDDQKNIFLYTQQENLQFPTFTKLNIKGKEILKGDWNQDGLLDLLVAGETEFSILYQSGKGQFASPQKYLNIKFSAIQMADVNGDQKSDLIFVRENQEFPLSIRLMNSQGTFGPELAFEISQPRQVISVQNKTSEAASLFVLNEKNASAKLYRFNTVKPTKENTFSFSAIRIYPFENAGSLPRDIAFMDLNEDGQTDLLFSDPETSQLSVHYQTQRGEFADIQSFSSLMALNGVIPGYYKSLQKKELLVSSQKEHSLGLSFRDTSGRISFPSFVPTQGKVLLATKGNLCGDERDEILYVSEEASRQYALRLLSYEGEGFVEKANISLPTKEVSARPREIIVEDINQDGKLDVILVLPMKPLYVLLNQGELSFKSLSESPNYREGLITDIGVGALNIDDLNGDGHKEIHFSQQNFLRIITVDSKNIFQIQDQFNGSQPSSEIMGSCLGDFNGDQVQEIALFNKTNKTIDILEKRADGSYQVGAEISIGNFSFRKMVAIDLSGDGKQDLFLLGKDQFGILFTGGETEQLTSVSSYVSEIKEGNVRFSTAISGDFNNDQQLDFALVESTENYLVFLAQIENQLVQVRKFKVFQVDQLNSQGQRNLNEPRELAQGDFNGDGKSDLVALVHDRVIFYYQE